MTDARPDPDQLLTRIKEEEARAKRGKLKIFFGASAGVGKTYAMLLAAHQQLLLGRDVVAGVIETHGRKETEALLDGLELLPLKEIPYRDRTLKDFDLDAALARRPQLLLMDELAHSNVAGSRHPKRWQDVDELLAAGIDVYSTVNVQHLDTLNDVVSGITGIRVWETVPDKVFDLADEVVLVDLPPDELLQRLKEGKVYLAGQAERAIRNFFRKGNLIALRELALRRTADRVDEQVLEYRRDKSVSSVWQTRESLLACVDAGDAPEQVVRGAARFAARLDVPWHAIYIETPELQLRSEAVRHRALQALKLAQDLGAETAAVAAADAPAAAVKYARDHNLSRVVVGRQSHQLSMGQMRFWHRSFAERVSRLAPDIDVTRIGHNELAQRRPAADQDSGRRFRAPTSAYLKSAAICAAAAIVAAPLYSLVDLANIVMIFLLAVVIAAVRYGRGPAVLASFLNVAAFDFLYVSPRYSFAVSDVQYLITFAIMLAVGLITGQLTASLKQQARVATRREGRVRALYEMSRDLSAALLPEQIVEICDRFIAAEFDARSAIYLADETDHLLPPLGGPGGMPITDSSVAQWAFDHGESAGLGTDTLPGSQVLYVPLQAPMRIRGILALEPRTEAMAMAPEQRRLLDTFARLIAIALERVHYVNVAQVTTVQMESERLRNSLLAAISHDLRTPLSALLALAESMSMTQPPPTLQQDEITVAMRAEARRMNSLIDNLLDMARLQAGKVKLNKQWTPLEEVVGTALKASDSALARHQVQVQLPSELPLMEMDAVLIERVLCNLLENAAKYTPPGSVIDIGSEVEGDHVAVWIEDNGPGLPPGREEELFKMFERGHKESATPGVGLGLAICRAIIEAHGGSIRADSAGSRQGARFVFTLPRGNPPALDGAEDGPAAAE